ncbi:MAG: transcription-repair coupling factor [Thermodesulfovibrionales bacterium]|nr:transcription-repair coupling factor [Thermodesulfovibrionales bacterium]
MAFTPFLDRIKSIASSSRIYNLTGSSMALFLALQEKPFVMVEAIEETAEALYRDILFFKSILHLHETNSIFFLPEPDGPDVCGKRADVVYRFRDGDSVVTSNDAAKTPLCLVSELKNSALILKPYLEISRDALEQKLVYLGYKHVPIVVEHGEFSRRGWLFDIFPSTGENPLRAEFFGDVIETIKMFDVSTQKSIRKIEEFAVLPAAEHSEAGNIFSVFKGANCFYSDSIQHPCDFPEGAVMLSKFSFAGEGIDAGMLAMAGYGIYHSERKSIYELPDAVKVLIKDNSVVMVAASKGQAERLRDIFMNNDVIAPLVTKENIAEYEGNISITVGELSSGFFLPGFLILTEKEIFGERPAFRPIKKSKVSELLISLDDLSPGDFIVHRDHGIGKFTGLVRQTIEGYEGDLMVLEYSNSDRLYLPLYGIERISKYYAEEGIVPKIDRLGGKTWQRTKEKAGKRIKEMAAKLLKLYAERRGSRGFSFSADSELHSEFDNFFLYDETPDQTKAIEEIKTAMESEEPMDMLLCGDVGYGKTEVAMRAAFKAVYDNRQAAVLVPTTLLCDQHYRTFSQRFSAFPVTVDYLSRFKSKKEQAETIRRTAKGEIDILIGTHTLLRKDIGFHNLGLLIIDEEHRFGVAQKEKIKEIKKGVDVLTLSATPIPRTLNMALSGIRGMSLIETPPEERLAVKGVVSAFNDELIRNAIEREIERGGQVYFVHNRINDMEKVFTHVRQLVPAAKVSIAHGQMHEKELERIMQRFINKEIDVLVSTTIIGSGLDIPDANTIIINRADMIGLADLYQLKGRVGRSNVRAYAYFIIPGEDILTDEAKKRLQAIQDMNYLGAGFRLAVKDLEIRGTGNLLGHEQSGHIHAVGFDMYIEMLESAVSELRGIKTEEEIEPRISLKISAFIPDEFIEDVTLRLGIYRKIASAKHHEDLDALIEELNDRFGRMPSEVQNLCDVMKLKITAKKLLITDITDMSGRVHVAFSKNTGVSGEKILGLYNILGKKVRFLLGESSLRQDGFEIDVKNFTWDETYKITKEALEKLY